MLCSLLFLIAAGPGLLSVDAARHGARRQRNASATGFRQPATPTPLPEERSSIR
jgi:hypothetical protein